jgi:hypothetical protein
MAIFEYLCANGHTTELFVPLAERDPVTFCTQCGELARFVLSATPTTFRAMDRKAFKRTGR